MFGIAAFSQVPYSSLASQLLLASASIDGSALVTANAYKIANERCKYCGDDKTTNKVHLLIAGYLTSNAELT